MEISRVKQDDFLPTRVSVHPTAFIAENCTLRGEIHVGAHSSLWFQTVLRGDTAPIRIGERTNIQDGSILHGDQGMPVEIGNDVTVGHAAVVHGAKVADEVLIAMRATVLSGAVIGRHSIIGAGALIKENFVVPEASLVLGIPGEVVRELRPEEVERVIENARIYVVCAEAYRGGRIRAPRAEEG